MTVAALPSTVTYVENGVTTSFAVPFRFKAATDLIVSRIADGIETVLVLGADYTVTGGSTDAGGTVTRTAATSGAKLNIKRQTVRVQPMEYTAGGTFPAKSHEEALDRQMLISQEQGDQLLDVNGRALTAPVGEAIGNLPSAADRAGKFIAFGVDPTKPIASSGTGADKGLRTDLASNIGGDLVGFSHMAIAGTLASPDLLGNSVAIRLSKELMITDYGAIGDGTSHPVSEWLQGGARDLGYADLVAIQSDYPDVRTLTDEIDYAAINKTIRRAYEIGYGVYVPPGTYFGWANVRSNGMSIRGQSSATCMFILPNGATHSVPNNNDGTGAMVTGVPCVIDLNNIGYGNTAPPISGFRISGLTLDGNRTGTTAPTHDLFGWALSGTRASDVVIKDVICQNAHCGGIGRFIGSDRWTIQATIKDCGLSTVDGSQRPGIDTNSSSWGIYDVVVIGCGYGSRLLDNCRFNSGTIRAQNCVVIGFLLYDQDVNSGSLYNDFTVFVDGGCAAQGVQIGTKARFNAIRAYVNGITGQPWYTVAATNPQSSPRDNSFRLYSTGNGLGTLREDGNFNTWEEIVTDGDGAALSQGAAYALDVYGSDNVIKKVTYRPTTPWKLRGLAFRTGAKRNVVSNCPLSPFPTNPWDDIDGANRLVLTRSTPQVAGNVTLSAEWGSAAAVTAISGNDLGGSIWITAAGSGRAANPSITIAWADGYVPAGKYTLNIDTLGGNGLGGATDSRQVLTDRFSFRYRGTAADSGIPADGGSYLFTWSLT